MQTLSNLVSRWQQGYERRTERFPDGTLTQSQSRLFHVLPFEIRDQIWRYALVSEYRLYLNPTIRTANDLYDDLNEAMSRHQGNVDAYVKCKVDYFAAAISRNSVTVQPPLMRTCRRV